MAGFGTGQSTYAGGVRPPLVVGAGALDARAFGASYRRYTYDTFRGVEASKVNGGAASGTTGDTNELRTGNAFGTPYEWGVIGTQTITVPVLVAAGDTNCAVAGVNFGMDQTLADGVEVIFGAKHSGVARGKHAFVSQSDRSFFAKWTLTPEDVSGFGPYYVGFKKAIAFGAVATYTDYFVIGLTAANDGKIYNVTNLNNAGAVTTDTGATWADLATKTIAVAVDGNGLATAYLNGVLLRTTPTFTFDSADVLVPYFREEHTTDVGGASVMSEFECGYVAPQGS